MEKKISCILFLLFFLIGIFGITINNNNMEFTFNNENKLTSFSNLIDKRMNHSFIQSPSQEICVWNLKVVTEKQIYLLGCNQSEIQQERMKDKLILRWNNIKFEEDTKSISIIVEINLEENSILSQWNLTTEFGTSGISLWSIEFPILAISPQKGNKENTFLASSSVMGKLYEHPFTYLGSFKTIYPSADQSMQFLSYYENCKNEFFFFIL